MSRSSSLTNLGPSIDMNTTVSLPGDGGAHSVGHSKGQGTSLVVEVVIFTIFLCFSPPALSHLLAEPQSQQSVSCLARLGDQDTDVVSEDWSASVKEVRRQVHHDRKLRKLL